METNSGGLESEDLMEMEDGEGSDLDDEEEELDDPISSPFQLALSDPASAATSTASSPPNNEDIPITPYTFSGKPLSIKRGRGRPRREGDKAVIRRSGGGAKVRRTKTTGYMRGIRRVKSLDRSDFDFSNIIPSPNDENLPMLDSDFGLFGISEREKMLMALEENPYPPEQWPGKVCALCNLGERSQLGQGDLMRLLCPDGFTPQRSISNTSHLQSMSDQVPDNESGDKSPRGPVTCRRQKSFNKCRMLSQNNEYIDELSIIGYTEEPDLQSIFEPLGIFFVHRRCATWSDRVIQPGLPNIGPIILQSTSRKCSYCNHFGASLACNADVCAKYYHFPCATAAGAFQDSKAVTTYCVQHLVQVPIVCESAVCYTCKMHGDIANLMFCSSCGEHYHGICVGLAQTPGIRAGWQCRKCRICQICRGIGDETKLMPCEQCDKVYHTTCQRPVVTSIPKYGWKCRCCRVCGDCGSRTPGAGSSSRWHNHYSVCDSCYQQRNKGYACPICGRSYRAHAQREMVQCITCRRFVHGTCDPEADMMTYQVRKDGHPDYEYVCGVCKSDHLKKQQIQQQRNSFEDGDSFSGSQDYLFDDAYDFDYGQLSDDSVRFMGLGRGKPYSASKIAKKRLGLSIVGRPKGIGKGMAGKLGFAKRQRLVEFGRKRGPKSKMRGMFGVPGVGLQKPTSDGSRMDEEPGVENRLVLCSVKDKYVLNQDICVMCGALGTDQEGCLISCVQCGQCYHPYCVNVKVTRVILQKGWRCLDCTVCEGCGHRHDESRLILCDECDISFHIYCMDPPLEYVPHGNWKCKWCAICQMCGATDPGFNCSWMNSYTECGPCASHTACASCSESYNEGDLIVQCIQCERWLHGSCDSIRSEKEAEKCVEDGYNCILCRPRDVPPPHLQLTSSPKPSTPCKSPDIKSNTPYFMDGISLQEIGYMHIKSLTNTPSITRKKRKKFHPVQDKEAGIMATIESVVAGSNLLGGGLDDKLELMDIKEDPQDLYKEGMLWTKEDGTPPDGFTLYTMESGVSVLRRKRQRNLQKLGIGGFIVRPRGIRGAQDNDDVDMLPGQLINESLSSQSIMDGDKPRRKPNRRKPKSKVFESYPPHIQEAFFGKLSLETAKGLESTSDSEEESIKSSKIGERTIQLSQDELRAVVAVTKHEKSLKQLSGKGISNTTNKISNSAPIVPKEEDESDTEVLRDVLTLPGDLLDTDLVNTIMNEDDDELTKNSDALRALGDSNLPEDANSTSALKETKDELTDILGSHFNIESIPNINSKDVEDIFKNVLTDESQESQESSSFSMSNTSNFSANGSQSSTSHPLSTAIRPTSLPTNNLNSPVGFPPQSPYHSEYSNSPQFSEPRSPWVTVNDTSDLEPASTPGVTTTYNQRSAEKMKADEGLGSGATISAVLYANMNHPEWKTEFQIWNDRYKQIIKKWRTLSTEQRAPYLQQARDNRSALRMKKQQQISKENLSSTSTASKTTVATIPVNSTSPSIQMSSIVASISEVCTHQSKPIPSLTGASVSSVSVSPPIMQPPRSLSLPPSPPTQQQFTIRGHIMGPGDHCGSAPNVTVNPLYQHTNDRDLTSSPRVIAPSAADQQIRVLTPSEIMRTLPSLSQENYEPQPLDQEKINQQQKTAREAEQERQWKQLQAIRQQQQQQHHVVLQEQRTQAIANVQRSLSDGAQPFMTDQVGVLQVPSQQISPSSPSSTSPQFYPLTIKGNQISSTHPPPSKIAQSPALPSPSSSNANQTIIDTGNLQKLSHPPTLHNKAPLEPTIHMPTTPRLQFTATRPNLQAYTSPTRQGDAPEMNPQLRDLLQRQQFKKLDEQLLPGKGQQRVWPPNDLSIQDSDQSNVTTPASMDVTFRQPLPPSTSRPKVATSGGLVLRQQGSVVGVRIPGSDPRMQSVDFRMKLLLQQQRGVVQSQQSPLQQPFQPGGQSRLSSLTNVRSSNVEQYEQILQKQAQIQNARQQTESPSSVPQSIIPIQRVPSIDQHVVTTNCNTDSSSNDQEIPDNVTAELEKLEQETGTMVELQGVSEILGGLGEDDDDILAEMGADFNILEYADPELDTLTGGEKTNILDSLDLVEPEPDKPDKREIKTSNVVHRVPVPPTSVILTRPNVILKSEPTMSIIPTSTTSIMSSRNLVRPSLPPPLAVSQHQASSNAQTSIAQLQLTPQQQMHQQMLLQVQHASSSGQPVSAGSKLLSDGVVNVVTSSNNVSLAFPANYAQRILNTHIQLQNQKLRLGTIGQGPRVALPSPTSSPQTILTELTSSRINLAPPPPPPPYPHPPPPYPGSSNTSQIGLRLGTAPMGPHRLSSEFVHSMPLQGLTLHLQRRPLLLEEQPLLLEDLLEQEKREQEKQLQTQTSTTSESHSGSALLSDHDFERLKADVLNSNIGLNNSGNVNVPGQNVNTSGTQIRSNFCSPNNSNQWQQSPVRPSPVSTPQASIDPPQIPTFNMTLLPAPPLPPENIVSEQDRQAQVLYEQWLNNQNAILTQQLKYYETEVQKLRKIRKSLNSKQRQLRKSGNQLPEADAIELQRISAEQAVLQKHLESSRKQSRQHGMLIQEYRNKQQAKQRPMPVQSPMMVGQQSQSPLNLPNSSPIQHPPQSPLMSPSPSPMMVQHNSPLQSPRPIVSHSPGLGVSSVIHSPSNASSNMSPRIGTPHSQSEGSPGSVPSPSQVCLPPPMPRMTSPQHRRIATSPITYSAELRPGMQQTRFVRPPITDQQHRPRLSISTANFLQRSSTPSPLNSPPPQQIQLTAQQQQQLLQRQLQQQALLLQQQNSSDGNQQSSEGTMHHSQRALQLIQQRQLIIRQQMLQQQVQQQQQQQTQVLTSQQHQVMVQQQIAKQQQLAQIQAQVQNVRINPQSQIVNQPPGSPMPPRSPMINQGQQIMSPHSVHSQPTSPMINLNPNSPMARSPALHQSNSQPPNSPMVQHHQVTSPLPRSPIIGSIKSPLSIRRPPSTNSNSSPIMLDHPMNIENPSTPRPQYTPPSYVDNDHSNGGGGGGNPNNPHNPLPMCGRFGFFKLGLRGGTPMWSLGRGAKRVPTNSDNKEDKIDSNHISPVSSKIKRESHLNKVSILKKKASTSKSNLKSLTLGKASSLVSSDYNEFDDSSSTPPVTPPPSVASTSRGLLHKSVSGKKLLEQSEIKDEIVVDNNMRCENVMDYDDDNDGAVVSTEVSLNSVAQQADSDDITVIETFSQNDLTDTISSPLEPGQIGEDYLLFPGNMVVDISNNVHYSDKEEDDEEEEYGEQIVNVAIQSPTPSEEELFIQGKTKQVDGLTLNIVHGLSSNQLLAVTDTPDSPEQEELNVDPSPEHYSQNTDQEILSHVDDSQVVLISRKDLDKTSNVDYEQLIDVTNEKIMKRETTPSNRLSDIHKYTTKSTTASLQSVNIPITSVSHAITLNTKTTTINLSTQKLSSTSTCISNNTNSSKTNILGTNVITRTAKFTNPNSPTLTSIILPIKTTTSPAITIVGSSSSRFTIPVISASAISKLTNVKVIDKPSSSLSLAAHDACLPKKIFDDESSVSPDSSTCEDEKFKLDFGDEKFKTADEKQCVNIEGESMENNDCNLIKNDTVGEHSLDNINEIVSKQSDTVQISNTSIKDHLQRLQSPAVMSNAPELKMTTQVVQGKGNANVQMTCGNVETIQASYVTTRDSIDCSNDSDNDSKSVVISIPSPTPSQEQLLDSIALQALENRRREGKRITSEFDTFEDVLDMIENITGETPTLLEANIKDKIKCDDMTKMTKQESNESKENKSQDNSKMSEDRKIKSPTELQIPVTVSTSGKSTIMPQLSPLSQPTDLTTNMANVSQQLRTLLSSLNTTTVTTSPNIATVVKSDIHNKDKVTGTCSSRIIQTSSILSPLISNANVIFSSAKQKPVVAFTVPSVGIISKNILVSSSAGSAFAPITTTLSSGSPNMTVTKVLTTSTSNIVQSIPDHPKLTLVTSVPSSLIQTCNLVTSVSQKPISVPVGTTATSGAQSMNKSLNLNAMLQSHPAATAAQIAPGTITTATILGSPITIAKSSFSPSMVHAQPTVVSPVVIQTSQTHSSTASPFISFSSSGITKPIVATTNLLHSQLTKVNVLRTKSNEEQQQQLTMDLIKKEEIKQEPSESLDLDISSPILQKSEFSGCKYSAIQCTNRVEDSQNVLLKQLLQNTACATTSQPLSASTTSGTISNAPSLPLVPNLEAQLARPVPPTPTSLLPPLLQNENLPVPPKTTMVTRETSFVSKHTTQPVAIQQLHIDVKKCLPPSRTPSRDELLSPPTPRSTCSQDSFIPTPPLYIKKEYQSMSSLPSPLLTPHEVKKEFVDDTSQHSEISDHSRPDIHIKEEMDLLDSSEKTTLEQKEELKKMKRRAYQQKRRQIQTMNKEMAGQPKKRARKSSKIDEDYDTYMEGVLAQLRTLPPMVVQEAQLHRNFGIASIFGGGDFSRLGIRSDLKCGELSGSYGNASVTGCSEFYSTKPYGNLDPLPPKPPISTQRGFYETEFPPLRFESEDDRKFELFCRDADTPDSVVSDSSGDECLQNDAFTKFLGLKLIDDYDDDEDGADESDSKENVYGKRPMSPIVPIVVPIPIRLKPLDPYLKDYSENDKENIYKDYSSKSKLTSPAGTLKDSGNVTVTLTLTSSAAEDIMGVLRDLANLLHIPPPTSYQIVERTGTPPSQKLGLYRTKGKDGKEGAPIDIQSILNGAAKFCKHCDVVILRNIIRKKVAELPNLSKWTEIVGDSDEIYFCSGACYMQFSIIHRIPPMPENKAATTIDYISQKETQKKSIMDHSSDNSLNRLSTLGRILNKQSTISDFMEVDHIKTESIYSTQHEELDFKQKHFDNFDNTTSPKVWRDLRYKHWITGCLQSNTKYKKPTDKETMELLYRLGITVLPAKLPEDTRRCMFCQNVGDGVADGPARLLNFDVDKWIHLNCGLWSDLVYETVNGALMNLENAIQISLGTVCIYCNKNGATIRCFKTRCSNIYHLPCAIKERCVFYKNKSVFCASHALKNDKDNEITTLSVSRRVYVNRDENRQVAAVMHHASDTSNLLRVGSLIFLNVGQLLPHQLQNFHTANYIYPIGYKIWRFYWSMRRVNKRCRYLCSIHEISGRPEFRVVVQDPPDEEVEFRDLSPKAVWSPILEQIAMLRKENHCLQVFPKYISGEDLFGLTEPAVVRVLESLPGIETLVDYKFKYGRNPLLELPLAVNPSGAARTEPKSRNQFNWKRPHTQRTGSSVRPVYVSTATGIGEAVCPYSKQFVHSKSSQYKKMKQEWKNNIYLARSKIQGLGLYAARDLEKHTMVIEYIGEIIRTELAETREKQYEARNRGIYMFRLDEERVIDATLSGGLARYINHSCNPNCVAEIVEVDRDLRIIIFAKRRIQRGEELAYDYKFDIEDDQHKISCMCGAPNCRKWMN